MRVGDFDGWLTGIPDDSIAILEAYSYLLELLAIAKGALLSATVSLPPLLKKPKSDSFGSFRDGETSLTIGSGGKTY